MKFEELKGKTQDELKKLLVESKKELFNLRFQKVSGELEKTHRVSVVRKTIAKIKTLVNQSSKKGDKKAA
jgi:large subunit ribosomal protein L29